MRNLSLVVLVMTVATPASAWAAAPGTAQVTCEIKGNDNPNNLFATTGPKVICARGGNDRVWGKAGNDTILGQSGRELLIGGGGGDTINGGTGGDTLIGGPGRTRSRATSAPT